MEDINSLLGTNIKALRIKHGFSQKDLASKLGISIQAVSKWERGKSAPDIMFLPNLSEIFKCSIDDLFLEIK